MSSPSSSNLHKINKEIEKEKDKKKKSDKKSHKDNAEERAKDTDLIEATACKIENLKIRKKKLSKDIVYQYAEDKETTINSPPVEGNSITSPYIKTHKKNVNPLQKMEEEIGATCTNKEKQDNLDLNAPSAEEMNPEDNKKLKEIKLEVNENHTKDVRNGNAISFENYTEKGNSSQKQTRENSKAENESDQFKTGNKVSGGIVSSAIARNLGSATLKGSSLPLLLSMPSGTGTGGSGSLSLLPAGLPPGRYVILPSTTSSIPSFSSIATNVSPLTVGTKSNLVAQISQPQKSAISSFTSSATAPTVITTINTSSVISSQSTAGRPNVTEERTSLGGGKAYRGRRKSYTAAEKLAMIEAVESGQKKSNVADQFGVAPSTLACILLQKNKIRCEQMKIDMSRRRLRQTRQMPIVPAPSNTSSKSLASSRSSRRGTEDPFVHFLSPLSPARPTLFEESPEEIISVPDLNERLGMEGSSSSGKIEGASSSFLTCSPLISSMPGIHEDVLSSGAGPSSSIQNSNENDGDYDEDMIDVKTEPVFNVESEICEEENSQSNTQSSSDRRSHQSSPTPSMIGPYLLKKETHCTTILDQLLRDDTFSDVTLTAEGQSIRAHKIVLCLASAYFRQVLSKESNVQNVIVFRDVKFSELKNLINFIYTGEATVDAADLESFMKTAEMLEVTSLCDGQRNFPKNLLPKTKESESEKVPSSTPSKTFPATKRSHAFTSAASNGSPPTKSRKTDAKDTSKKSSLVLPHPSTSGGGGGTSCPNDSIIEPTTTIIKTEPVSEDSVAEEDYELKVGTDVSFESLTRSPPPPPLAAQNQVSTDLGENQSSLPDQSACSSMSLEKVPVGKCPLCPSSQPIRKGSELTKHLYAHHPDKTVFCCESCSRVFLKKGSFEAHKNDCNR